MTAIALTIAGSDSSGGAGIEADLKTFSALGVYGAAVITALTAQNTGGVFGIHDVPADFVAAQINAVFTDLDVGAVKIGMLANSSAIDVVAAALYLYRPRNVVLDPIMIASSGERLLRARRHAQFAGGRGSPRHAAGARRGRNARASAKAADARRRRGSDKGRSWFRA